MFLIIDAESVHFYRENEGYIDLLSYICARKRYFINQNTNRYEENHPFN